MSDQEKKARLDQERQSSKDWGVSDTAKNITDAATPAGAVSLLSQASVFDDMPFVVAFGAAILKDVLDLGFLGSLPAIGTVLTIMASITIFFMILLSGNNGKRRAVNGMMKQGLALALGTLVEFLFGLNFLPVETATVFVIYFMVLSDRKKAAEEETKEVQEAQIQQNNLVAFPSRQNHAESENDQGMRRAA